jgi:hypothetical protein
VFRSLPSFTPQRVRVDLIAIRMWIMSNVKVGKTRVVCRDNEKACVNRPPVSLLIVPGFVMPYPEIAKIMNKINVGHTSSRLNLCK